MRVRWYVLMACAVVAACEWPTPVCACTPPYAEYRVSGTVSLASGAPVAGASVVATFAGSSCASVRPPLTFEPFGSKTSASDGSFAMAISQFGDLCVRLVARRPAAADSIVETIDLTQQRRTQTVSMRFP